MAGGEAAVLHDHSPSPETAQEPPATYNLFRITSAEINIYSVCSHNKCWFFRQG